MCIPPKNRRENVHARHLPRMMPQHTYKSFEILCCTRYVPIVLFLNANDLLELRESFSANDEGRFESSNFYNAIMSELKYPLIRLVFPSLQAGRR